MGARRKFSAEYKREAVAMLDAPGVTVCQIATDLGIGTMSWGDGDVSCATSIPAFVGNGRSRDGRDESAAS